MLDEPLDVRCVEARNLMEVVDAKSIERAFEAWVDALEPLEIVAWPERLHHDPRRRPRLTSRPRLELGLSDSTLEALDVIEHPFVNPVQHLELGPQPLTPGLRLPQGGLRFVTLLDSDTKLTPQIFGGLA